MNYDVRCFQCGKLFSKCVGDHVTFPSSDSDIHGIDLQFSLFTQDFMCPRCKKHTILVVGGEDFEE